MRLHDARKMPGGIRPMRDAFHAGRAGEGFRPAFHKAPFLTETPRFCGIDGGIMAGEQKNVLSCRPVAFAGQQNAKDGEQPFNTISVFGAFFACNRHKDADAFRGRDR